MEEVLKKNRRFLVRTKGKVWRELGKVTTPMTKNQAKTKTLVLLQSPHLRLHRLRVKTKNIWTNSSLMNFKMIAFTLR